MESEPLAHLFIDHSIRKLRQMHRYLETCLSQVDASVLTRCPGPGQNSIANLILHLCGNLRQWIGSNLGGQADVRDRTAEFEPVQSLSRETLLTQLREAVEESVKIIAAIDAGALARTVTTQDGPLSVLEVIYQVVGHFQQHTGQVIFAVKQATGRDLQLYRALQ